MSHIFETVTGASSELAFKHNGHFALKNYNVEIINGNRLKVTSTQNELFSLLEADISEVEINGTTYTDPIAAQVALSALVHSDVEPVVLTKEKYMQLAAAVQAADRGKILPDTPAPSGGWQPGWYTPGKNENTDPGTNYPLQNNLKAKKGFITKFLFNGTTWDFVEYEIPEGKKSIINFGDIPSGDFPLQNYGSEKVQVIENNSIFQLKDGESAGVGDVPGSSDKWISLGYKNKYLAGTNFAVIYKTESSTSENSHNGHYLNNNGEVLNSGGFFISAKIKKEDDSVSYTTEFFQTYAGIAVYDIDNNLIAAKIVSELSDNTLSLTTRLLSDDFNLTNVHSFAFSCYVGQQISVTYAIDIDIPAKTISEINFDSEFPINSEAVKPLQAQINQISKIAKDIELLNNYVPYFEPADKLMQGYWWDNGADPQKTVVITARTSDKTFTVNPADITNLQNGQNLKVVIFDGSTYFDIGILSINTTTGVFTTSEVLPTTCINFQHLWGDGIHLSKYGYKAEAKIFAENNKMKYSQRKGKVFGLYGYMPGLSESVKDWIVNGETVLVMNKLTPGTKSGGWIDQPNGITATFENQGLSGYKFLSSKFPKHWQMNQNVAGDGLEFTLPTNVQGYAKFILGCDYRQGVVTGLVHIEITDQKGNVLFDEDLTSFGLIELLIDLNLDITSITVKVWLLQSVTTIFTIDQIEVFSTYFDETPFIKIGESGLFEQDSWGVHTTPVGSEVSALRPDGSTLGGLGLFPNELSQLLGTEKFNFSRGNQTSEWGRYWIEHFINLCPQKPDFCIVNFFINDCNSEGNWDNKIPSAYDFDPNDPYATLSSASGGIFGSTNDERWLSNLKYICATLRRYNIRPVIIGYPQLGGVNYTYARRAVKFLMEF